MRKKLSIVGGGTAALFLAAFIDTAIYEVTIYEQKKNLGRKFLVAGDGGFNLTHSEDMYKLKLRYRPYGWLDAALSSFTNEDMRKWLESIGVPTFIGSSKRIFPEKQIKPIQVLQAIMRELESKRVQFRYGMTLTGLTDTELIFNDTEHIKSLNVFALGGASWKVTGSDGLWSNIFNDSGVQLIPFQSHNCAFGVDWSENFL